MNDHSSDPIRQWFAEHDDGEFLLPTPGHAYSVVPAMDAGAPIVYATKRHSLLAIIDNVDMRPPFTLIARGGLPEESDVAWLLRMAVQRKSVYFGDADPVDLLIFAWLRSRTGIEFCGVSDRLLEKLGVCLLPELTIAMSPSESEAMPLLEQQFPDYVSVLGPACSSLLADGRKLEVEALFSFATIAPAMILDFLCSPS